MDSVTKGTLREEFWYNYDIRLHILFLFWGRECDPWTKKLNILWPYLIVCDSVCSLKKTYLKNSTSCSELRNIVGFKFSLTHCPLVILKWYIMNLETKSSCKISLFHSIKSVFFGKSITQTADCLLFKFFCSILKKNICICFTRCFWQECFLLNRQKKPTLL